MASNEGLAAYNQIVRNEGVSGQLLNLISNDIRYFTLLEAQKILNVAHILHLLEHMNDSFIGPLRCLQYSCITYGRQLRCSIREEAWLYGIVVVDKPAYDAVYNVLSNATIDGDKRLPLEIYIIAPGNNNVDDYQFNVFNGDLGKEISCWVGLNEQEKRAVMGILSLSPIAYE